MAPRSQEGREPGYHGDWEPVSLGVRQAGEREQRGQGTRNR